MDDIIGKLEVAYRRDKLATTDFWTTINTTFNDNKDNSAIKDNVNDVVMALIGVFNNSNLSDIRIYLLAIYTDTFGNQPWLYGDVLGEMTGNEDDGYTFSPKFTSYKTTVKKNDDYSEITGIQFQSQINYPDTSLLGNLWMYKNQVDENGEVDEDGNPKVYISEVYAIFGLKTNPEYSLSDFSGNLPTDGKVKYIVHPDIYDRNDTNAILGTPGMQNMSYGAYITSNGDLKYDFKYNYLVNIIQLADKSYWYLSFYNGSYTDVDNNVINYVCIESGTYGGLHAIYKTTTLPNLNDGEFILQMPYQLGFSNTKAYSNVTLYIRAVIPDLHQYTLEGVTDIRQLLYTQPTPTKGEPYFYIESVSSAVSDNIPDYKRFVTTFKDDGTFNNGINFNTNGLVYRHVSNNKTMYLCSILPSEYKNNVESKAEVKLTYNKKTTVGGDITYSTETVKTMTLDRNDNSNSLIGTLKKGYDKDDSLYYQMNENGFYNANTYYYPELYNFGVNESIIKNGVTLSSGSVNHGFPKVLEDLAATMTLKSFFVSYCYDEKPKLWMDPDDKYSPIFYSNGTTYEKFSETENYTLSAANLAYFDDGVLTGLTGVSTISSGSKDVSNYITISPSGDKSYKDTILFICVELENIDADPTTGKVYFDTNAGLSNGARKKFYLQLVLDASDYMNNPGDNGRRLLIRYNSGDKDNYTYYYYVPNNDQQYGFKITQQSNEFAIVFSNDGQLMINKTNNVLPANTRYGVYSPTNYNRDSQCDLYLTEYEIMAAYYKGDPPEPTPVQDLSKITLYTNNNYNYVDDFSDDYFKNRLEDYVTRKHGNNILVIAWSQSIPSSYTYTDFYVSYKVNEKRFTVHYTLDKPNYTSIETLKYNGRDFVGISTTITSKRYQLYNGGISTDLLYNSYSTFSMTFFNIWYNYVDGAKSTDGIPIIYIFVRGN